MDFSFPAVIGMVSVLWGGGAPDTGPKAFLEHVYDPPTSEQTALTQNEIYSDRLLDLFDHYHKEARLTLTSAPADPGPVELVPFDPLSLGQTPTDLKISDPVIRDDHAMADISFDANSGPVQLSVSMVQEDGSWRIDDIASFGGDGQQWLLSWLLQYDPVGAE